MTKDEEFDMTIAYLRGKGEALDEVNRLKTEIERLRAELAEVYEERDAAINEADKWAHHWEVEENIAERLREALHEAIDEVEAWASYASPAMQEKHDLEGVLTKLRSALGKG